MAAPVNASIAASSIRSSQLAMNCFLDWIAISNLLSHILMVPGELRELLKKVAGQPPVQVTRQQQPIQ
jgi:hypothetical protein